MTVTNKTNTVEEAGNGTKTDFTFSFKAFAAGDMRVFKVDTTTLVATLQTITTDYTVTLNTTTEGGTIAYVVAPTASQNSFIKRLMDIDQQTAVPTEGNIPEDSLNNEYDKSRMIDIQQQDELDRTIQLAETSALSDIVFPESTSASARAGKIPAWDSAGTALELVAATSVDAVSVIAVQGDIVQGNASGTAAKLAIGLDHQILNVLNSTGLAAWGYPFAKGVDIASATNLVLGADGNVFDVTGTTTIATLSDIAVGMLVILQFDGALTLTHSTDLVLPGSIDILTVAGDIGVFHQHATGDWRLVSWSAINMVGQQVQMVNTQTGAVATGTTVIPDDDTIPQNTEGDQYMTLAITPKNTNNKLKIEIVCHISNSAGGSAEGVAALFQDSTANALACGFTQTDGASNDVPDAITFTHFMTAGTTSATTFKIRAGWDVAGTTTFNGQAAGRLYGGVLASSITITEIKV